MHFELICTALGARRGDSSAPTDPRAPPPYPGAVQRGGALIVRAAGQLARVRAVGGDARGLPGRLAGNVEVEVLDSRVRSTGTLDDAGPLLGGE